MSKNSARQPWSVPVSPYFTGSDFLSVYISKNERHLYRFAEDLTQAERELIHRSIRDNVGLLWGYVDCGDLIQPKYSKK